MKKIIYIICFMIMGLGITEAQNPLSEFTTPSANTASLGSYGGIPINLSTGTPQISLPLTTVKDHNLKIPISLNYSTTGLKQEQKVGWLGQGWSLSNTNYITRIVKGQPDEKSYTLKKGNDNQGNFYPGFFYNYDKLTPNDWASKEKVRDAANRDAKATYEPLDDLERDEFIINIDGYFAKFYFSHSEIVQEDLETKWIVQGDPGVKIKATIDRYHNECHDVHSSLIDKKFTMHFRKLFGAGDGNDWKICNRTFINGFEVTLPNGYKYYFGRFIDNGQIIGHHNAVEFSKSLEYDDPTSAHHTTWYLVKVVEPLTEKEVNYTYGRHSDVVIHWGVSLEKDNINGIIDENTNLKHSGNWLLAPYLASIETDNYMVEFEKSTIQQPYDWKWFFEDEYIYTGLFRTSIETSSHHYVNGNYNLMNMEPDAFKLDEINVFFKKSNGEQKLIDKYTFAYNTDHNDTRLRLLTVYDISKDGTADYLKYDFDYNLNINCNGEIISDFPYLNDLNDRTDHWGYFNNIESPIPATEFGDLSDYTDADFAYYKNTKIANDCSLLGVLTTITYATGGETRFEWEPNEFTEKVVRSETTGDISLSTVPLTKGGGLRIAMMEDDPKNGNDDDIITKTYSYGNGVSGHDFQYWWDNLKMRDNLDNINDNSSNSYIEYDVFTTRSLKQASFTHGSFVSYSNVTEYLSDNGRIYYIFTNYTTDYSDKNDANYQSTININTSAYTPLESRSLERGLERHRYIYNETGDLVFHQLTEYEDLSSVNNVLQLKNIQANAYNQKYVDPDNYVYTGAAYYTNIYVKKPVRVRTEYTPDAANNPNGSITKNVFYEYNDMNLLESETKLNSKHDYYKTLYRYTFEESDDDKLDRFEALNLINLTKSTEVFYCPTSFWNGGCAEIDLEKVDGTRTIWNWYNSDGVLTGSSNDTYLLPSSTEKYYGNPTD